MSDLTAVILAGGLGTRLRPVIADRSKVLAPIHGQPFITYLLNQLLILQPKQVIMCIGHLGDHLRQTLGDSYSGLKLTYSPEESPLGTAGALRQSLPMISTDSILMMNGDSYCGVDLNQLRNWHNGHAASATLTLIHTSDSQRYGSVRCDNDGRITQFEEKNQNSNTGWINAGIYMLTRSFIESIPVNVSVSIERDVFPKWIGRGLYGWQTEGRFIDIGTPESYSLAENFFNQ